MDHVRVRIQVTGRVQGVGFRWFTRASAQALGLVGWVRNLSDGSVLCEAQGTRENVDAFCARVAEGPPGALVARVERTELRASEPPEGAFAVVR